LSPSDIDNRRTPNAQQKTEKFDFRSSAEAPNPPAAGAAAQTPATDRDRGAEADLPHTVQ
jgi:hypothetical protein